MLSKNIYILFPPGYSGTYVSWLLSKSERDSADTTVDDPINPTNDKNLGGAGTSHRHVRIPTHHGLGTHLSWVLYNLPTDFKIYLINSRVTHQDRRMASEEAIFSIMNYDPDPIFVHIHDNNDQDWRAVANINCITKWPVYFRSEQNLEKKFGFDCFDIDNRRTRNLFAQFRKLFFPYNDPIRHQFIVEKLKWMINWYQIRHEYNPHEVNEETYLSLPDRPHNLHEIHLRDIFNNNIFDLLENIIRQGDCGEYDFSYVRNFHHNYVEKQTSLNWIKDIDRFRKTGTLSEYLRTGPMSQALVVEEMLPVLINSKVDWKNLSTEECADAYRHLKGLS